MDILQVLQTIGICVGAVALVAIAFMLFMIISTFLPSLPPEDELIAVPLERKSRRKQRKKGGSPTDESAAGDGTETGKSDGNEQS